MVKSSSSLERVTNSFLRFQGNMVRAIICKWRKPGAVVNLPYQNWESCKVQTNAVTKKTQKQTNSTLMDVLRDISPVTSGVKLIQHCTVRTS